MTLTIRPERPEDFPVIHELVRRAFENAEHADGDEHFLVDRLRQSPEYIPELCLVAEYNGQIAGHIMFTKLKVGDHVQLALAPLSVLPEFQGKGIGGALIRHGHELARGLGWQYIILLGHAGYYPRFGYKPASSFGILPSFDVPDEAFMAINLTDNTDHFSGMVHYSAAFIPENLQG